MTVLSSEDEDQTSWNRMLMCCTGEVQYPCHRDLCVVYVEWAMAFAWDPLEKFSAPKYSGELLDIYQTSLAFGFAATWLAHHQ